MKSWSSAQEEDQANITLKVVVTASWFMTAGPRSKIGFCKLVLCRRTRSDMQHPDGALCKTK